MPAKSRQTEEKKTASPAARAAEEASFQGRPEAVDQILQSSQQHSEAALEHLRDAVDSIDRAAAHLESQKSLSALGRVLQAPIVRQTRPVVLSALVVLPLLAMWNYFHKPSLSEEKYKELIEEATATVLARKPAEAIEKWSYLIERKPNPSLYCQRANSKCNAGDYDGALADCLAALKLDPKYGRAYHMEYVIYMRSGQPAAARAALERAVALGDGLSRSTLHRLRERDAKTAASAKNTKPAVAPAVSRN